ncbi:MAG: hypothetical protein LBD45_05915 [Bacteroidales bacterium]|jgi:hypothetical protein|nr:hypothetical protein [Bacteroidales bacterium]
MLDSADSVKNKTVFQQKIVLWAGFVGGVVIKLFMLSYEGIFDMDSYYAWGNKALEEGLYNAFHGIYFPFQYNIFQGLAWIVKTTNLNFTIVFKMSNLLFDVGSFFLLIKILSNLKINPLLSLIYWLHPWFLMVFSQGYIDFHFAFFVLLTISFLLEGKELKRYVKAGIAFGFAFLMKPQAQILIVVIFFYTVLKFIREREIKPFSIFIGSVALFMGYMSYFVLHSKSIFMLPFHYLNVANMMPCLTAHMPNIWYPVAYFLKEQNAQIYSVSDKIHLLPFLSCRSFAIVLSLVLCGVLVNRIYSRNIGKSEGKRLLYCMTIGAVILPFTMTSAHENHLFLGTILLISLMGKMSNAFFSFTVHAMLAIQFINLTFIYGTSQVSKFFRAYYTYDIRFAVSLFSIATFISFLYFMFKFTASSKIISPIMFNKDGNIQ